ncbi:hypothetical protein PV396_32460 [Streptomyces sp. ME02-8801-2C]|uniref:hypothetical protein n=1 Tax=Streptomyces sp. ME02-8801-2C TaxID=3028680 RepID=UPI0029AF64E6|nr:hypothetical protein [Streptomyces sp. ME02-8801-2C]MDX3456611.1 hypothetical protein [Streptomyces sp. ME02-8801-2C]
MAADPTDPKAFEEITDPENAENPGDHEDYEAEDDTTEVAVEAPEGDAAEQHREVTPQHDERLTGENTDRANEADLAEQARVVELDEDDYR